MYIILSFRASLDARLFTVHTFSHLGALSFNHIAIDVPFDSNDYYRASWSCVQSVIQHEAARDGEHSEKHGLSRFVPHRPPMHLPETMTRPKL